MKKTTIAFLVLLIMLLTVTPVLANANDRACWGQASAVFAQTGVMGEHASQMETPRLGLANLARALYASGDIPDDSMQALGQFVVQSLGLEVSACMP